jgi:hypothetical protein
MIRRMTPWRWRMMKTTRSTKVIMMITRLSGSETTRMDRI